MRDQKHTPGTWATEADFIMAPTLCKGNSIHIYSTDPGPENDYTIGYAVDVDKPTREANAKILAAAPELLALVERAEGIRHPNTGKWTKAETERSWAEWDTRARAVIAKATARP